MDEYWGLDENVLKDCVEVGMSNLIEREIESGDAMVVEEENLDE